MKVSAPAAPPATAPGAQVVAVHKSILTRRHYLVSSSSNSATSAAGYDIELVAIRNNGRRSWSICVETFGGAEQCAAAFRAGIAELLDDGPAPESLALTVDRSFGYPAWISRYATPTASPLPTDSISDRGSFD